MKIAWAITGSGHELQACLQLIEKLPDVDLFLSRAGDEILKQYGYQHKVGKVFLDKTASSVPVGLFYQKIYQQVIIAPASSNTVAKMVHGISDTLVTNIYAQSGKCGIPSIIYACDTEPQMISVAPKEKPVQVFPRAIDLENTARLEAFALTTVVKNITKLKIAIEKNCL